MSPSATWLIYGAQAQVDLHSTDFDEKAESLCKVSCFALIASPVSELAKKKALLSEGLCSESHSVNGKLRALRLLSCNALWASQRSDLTEFTSRDTARNERHMGKAVQLGKTHGLCRENQQAQTMSQFEPDVPCWAKNTPKSGENSCTFELILWGGDSHVSNDLSFS